jgi:hypothetical protein
LSPHVILAMIRDGTSVAEIAHGLARRKRRSTARAARGFLLALLILAFALCAAAFVSYVLWPRWPGSSAVSLDAPALPITVADIVFNVPPAAIRVPMQRRTGPQERIDLVFLWPSLTPPDPAGTPAPGAVPAAPFDRVFLTIAGSNGALSPVERKRVVYPRYTVREPEAGPDGLAVLAFRSGTPYQGEDLVYEAAAPDRFFVRCTRAAGPVPGSCLREQRIGGTDVTVRFPRAWLDDWRELARGIEQLVAGLRPG